MECYDGYENEEKDTFSVIFWHPIWIRCDMLRHYLGEHDVEVVELRPVPRRVRAQECSSLASRGLHKVGLLYCRDLNHTNAGASNLR